MEHIIYGIIASLFAGLATGIGSLPIFFIKDVSDRVLDVMLGFAARVMLVASSFSLLLPALELSNIWVVSISFSLGALLIHVFDRYIPHTHIWTGVERKKQKKFLV